VSREYLILFVQHVFVLHLGLSLPDTLITFLHRKQGNFMFYNTIRMKTYWTICDIRMTIALMFVGLRLWHLCLPVRRHAGNSTLFIAGMRGVRMERFRDAWDALVIVSAGGWTPLLYGSLVDSSHGHWQRLLGWVMNASGGRPHRQLVWNEERS